MLTIKWPAVALLALAPGIMSLAVGDEEKEEREEKSKSKVESAEIPDAAKAALKRLAGKSKIERIVVEGDDVKVFEGLWKKEGEVHEATVSAQGVLLETEEVVEGDEVPKAVKKVAAAHKEEGVRITYVKKVITLYEIEITEDDEEESILVDPAGRKVEVSYEDEEGEEGEEAEKGEGKEEKKAEKDNDEKGEKKSSKSKESDEDDEKSEKKASKDKDDDQ